MKKKYLLKSKGGTLWLKKKVFAVKGGNFAKKIAFLEVSLSNMPKKGLRMVVSLKFDLTHNPFITPPYHKSFYVAVRINFSD